MEVDCIKNSTPDLLAKACQTKEVLTEVEHQLESTVLAKKPARPRCFRPKCFDQGFFDSTVSRECLIKNFDVRPFSYICRIIVEEPNTNMTEMDKSETVAPQFEHVGNSLTEEFIEGRHFICH